MGKQNISDRSNPWDRPSSLLLLAVWFGLLIGWGEATCMAVLHGLRKCRLDMLSPYLWAIPITDAALLAAPGIALYFLARFRIISCRLDVITLLFSLLLFIDLILSAASMTQTRLYTWAMILLACGLAVQFMRLAARHPRGFYKLVKCTTPVLIAAIVIVAGVTLGRDALNRRNLALNIPPAPSDAPNVLFIVLDTVRAKSMSLYGYDRPTTPNLERWAKRGVVFDQAVSTAPFTVTSHASMFTGKYPHELSANWTVPLDRTYPTLAEILYEQGYMTAGVAANTRSCGRQTGLGRGFVHYEAHRLDSRELSERSSLARPILHRPPISAAEVNARFLEVLPHLKGRPFFAFLNYLDCHTPYFATAPLDQPDKPYSKMDRGMLLNWTSASFVKQGADGLELARGSYEASLGKLDQTVDELLVELEKRGELSRTIVIIVGDHGEQFGEHGLVQHADSLYRSVLHVPLMIIDPRKSAGGRRVHEMVSLVDLPATILELLELPAERISGHSFAGLINSPDSPGLPLSNPKFAFVSRNPHFPAWHPNSSGPVKAIFLDGMHYIKSEGKEELYDFENDPEEQQNLAESEALLPLMNLYRQLIGKDPTMTTEYINRIEIKKKN